MATAKAAREGSEEVAPRFEEKGGVLLYESRYVIPDGSTLKLKKMAECHDSKVAGYFGQFKTIEL